MFQPFRIISWKQVILSLNYLLGKTGLSLGFSTMKLFFTRPDMSAFISTKQADKLKENIRNINWFKDNLTEHLTNVRTSSH